MLPKERGETTITNRCASNQNLFMLTRRVWNSSHMLNKRQRAHIKHRPLLCLQSQHLSSECTLCDSLTHPEINNKSMAVTKWIEQQLGYEAVKN